MAASKSKQQLSGNNFIIVMLLISLLAVGISAIAAKSLYGAIVRDTKVRTAKEDADKKLKADVKAAPMLVDAYNNLGSQKTVIANALPNTTDLPGLLVVLENMSSAAGLHIKTVAPVQASGAAAATSAPATATGSATASSAAPQPQSYDFSITFDGSYAGLQKFLQEVEVSARPMRVLDMQLNGSGNSLSGQLDMETYFQDKATLPLTKEIIK